MRLRQFILFTISMILGLSLFGCGAPNTQQTESDGASSIENQNEETQGTPVDALEQQESPSMSEADYQNMVIEWIVNTKDGKKTYGNFLDASAHCETNSIPLSDIECVIDGNALLAYLQQETHVGWRDDEERYTGQKLTVIDWNSDAWDLEDGLVHGEIATGIVNKGDYEEYGFFTINTGRYGTYDDEMDPVIHYTAKNGQTYSFYEKVIFNIHYSPTQGFLTGSEAQEIREQITKEKLGIETS